MWCSDCQQDVPGVATAEEDKYACPRCGKPFAAETAVPHGPADGVAAPKLASTKQSGCRQSSCGSGKPCSCSHQPEEEPVVFEPIVTSRTKRPPLSDSWELDQQLRHIERVLRVDKPKRRAPDNAPTEKTFRIHAAHHDAPERHQRPKRKKPKRRQATIGQGGRWLMTVTWSMLSLGSMALACGGVLLGWSMVTGRNDLWSLGTPIVLIGQLILLAGFILQLDRLWQNSRAASVKLENVDRRLTELKTTTNLLGTTQSTSATNFYSHMAGGANPELLLADLKGQLDLLAVKISRIDR